MLLLTCVIPWGVHGGEPLWSWSLFNERHGTSLRAMLIGAWVVGGVVLAAGVALRGLGRAMVYLLAGGTALALYLRSTDFSPLPWQAFVPIATRHSWLLATGVAALVMFLTATGLRARGMAHAVLGALQCLSSVAAAAFVALAIRDCILAREAGRLLAMACGLAVGWLALAGCALGLLGALEGAGVESGRTVFGRRLMLAGLALLLGWAVFGPVVESGAFSAVFGPLNNGILVAGVSLVTIEGLVGALAQMARASGAEPCAVPAGSRRWVDAGAAGVSLVAVVAVAIVASGARVAKMSQEPPPPAPRAGDWSEWCGGPSRNMISGEKGLPWEFDQVTGQKTSGLTNVKWVVRLGNQTFGSPVISGGKVFISGGGASRLGLLFCFRESDGGLLWRMRSPYISGLYGTSYGMCSTPTIEGNRVYTLGHLGDVLCLNANGMANGNRGPFTDEAAYFADNRSVTKSVLGPEGARILECTRGEPAVLTPLDADIIWTFDMLRQTNCWPFNALNAATLIRGDRLYAATCSTSTGTKPGSVGHQIQTWKNQYRQATYDSPSLIVLDKNTGKLLARDVEHIFEETFHGSHASPALGKVNGKELLFYGAGNGTCYAFDPDFAPEPDGKPGKLKLVWKFNCLDASSYGRNFGVERLGRGETIGTPVFYRNRIYTSIGNDLIKSGLDAGLGRLVCIDATGTGDITSTGRIWSFDEMRSTASTVAIADGLLYTGDASGSIYCLDAETGKVYWTHQTAPVWGSPLVADGKVYVGTHNRGLLVFAHGQEKKLLSQSLGSADIVASPVAANGVLYVAIQKHLYALQLGGKGRLVEHGD